MMNEQTFRASVFGIALFFVLFFAWVVVPPLLAQPDILAAFAGGFVNPYASGYSTDVICCWLILLAWVLYEYPRVKYGWLCLLLGIVPGVAVGFALYLILRMKQINFPR